MIFTRGRCIREVIIHSSLTHAALKSGCHKCSLPNDECELHQILTEGDCIVSMATSRTFPIPSHLSCLTPHVIYVITCGKCGLQGVGECANAVQRGKDYVRAARSTRPTSKRALESHFQDPSHSPSDLSMTLVDCVPRKFHNSPAVAATRIRLENLWIRKLSAQLNVRRQWWRSMAGASTQGKGSHKGSRTPPHRPNPPASRRRISSHEAVVL